MGIYRKKGGGKIMALGRGKKRYSIDSETFELNEQLKSQDEQLESIKNAEKKSTNWTAISIL